MGKSEQLVVLAAGGGLLWWLMKRPGAVVSSSSGAGQLEGPVVATVTTYEGFDLSAYGGPTSYPEPIKRFAQAIARQEGFYVTGAIPQRANNPGDLKAGPPYLPGSQITQFASPDLGWNALYRQLWLILTGQSKYYTLDMSIDEMSKVWTATQQEPWAANVSAYLGVSRDARLWQVLA